MTDTARLGAGVYAATPGPADLLGTLDIEGRLLLRAARAAGPDAEVPFCPGWTARELTAHVGWVYRWVAMMVTGAMAEPPGREARLACTDPDPADFDGVLARTDTAHREVVAALTNVADDVAFWTTWATADSSRAFWCRRMVHETVVHRVDAENAAAGAAAGGEGLAVAVAADGVDELVCGFAVRYSERLRASGPAVLAVEATDVPYAWWARIGPDAPEFGRGAPPAPADAVIRGRAGELLLFLWNRRPLEGLDASGDADLIATWTREAHL